MPSLSALGKEVAVAQSSPQKGEAEGKRLSVIGWKLVVQLDEGIPALDPSDLWCQFKSFVYVLSPFQKKRQDSNFILSPVLGLV